MSLAQLSLWLWSRRLLAVPLPLASSALWVTLSLEAFAPRWVSDFKWPLILGVTVDNEDEFALPEYPEAVTSRYAAPSSANWLAL
jgi:hypothetical protein